MEPAKNHGSICKTHPVQKVGENTAKRKLLTPKRINLENVTREELETVKIRPYVSRTRTKCSRFVFNLKKKYLQNARALASRTLNHFGLSS